MEQTAEQTAAEKLERLEAARQMTPIEKELDAVTRIAKALLSLPEAARDRVIRYVTDLVENG